MFAFEYSNSFENLSAAVIGPFSEIVIILDSNNDRFYFNTGISDSVAFDLVSHLEVAMRRWCSNSKRELNFNVAKIHDVNCMKIFHDTILDSNFTKVSFVR